MSIAWGAVSGWWALACLLVGLLYAWLLYRQPSAFDNKFRYALFALRALAIFVVSFLLLAPLVRSVSYQPQKPLVLVLQDNSASIKLFSKTSTSELANKLSALKTELGDNYDTRFFNFDHALNNGLSNTFNGRQTDISAALKQLNDHFVNQNIGAIVLATDGLYNQGSDPQYEIRNFKTVFYTIALGDTTPKRDLLIGNVNYNKTAFLGNDFMIEVLAAAYQSKGENMRLTVTEDGRQVSTQNISVSSDAFQKLFPIKLTADKKGVRKFTISIAPVKNELSTQNNTETIYVDVLDARQKVLLVYNGPGPDVNVIKQAIESNRNYEVKNVQVTGLSAIKPADYNLAIFYQLSGGGQAALQTLEKSKIPLWYMLGAQSNLQDFNMQQSGVKISAGREDMQEVFPQIEPGFSAFTLSDSTRLKLAAMPPLLAPFGSYTSSPGNQVLLKQRIGNVITTYPLLSFVNEGGRRVAILTGEGLWRWGLAEYKAYGNHHAIEELLSQSVQYLTANANRQQFRAYPAKNVFDEGENVILNAELYNDALNLVNTPDVKIDLKGASGKNYNFLFTRNGQGYMLDAGALPVDEYSYMASAKLGAKTYTSGGRLIVKPLNLETRQSAANHQLLNNIAKQSGGQMLPPSQLDGLAGLIKKNENIKTVVYQDKHYTDLVDIKWVFFIVLVLLSCEWFLRKREGEI